MRTTPLLLTPRGRDVLGNRPALVAIVGTVLAFGVLGTPVAAVLGLLPAIGFVLGGPMIAFALGTVAVAGFGGLVGLPPVGAVVVLTGLLGVEVYEDGRRPALLFAALVAAVAGSYVAIRATEATLFTTTAVIVGALALASYLLHRYELVTLGLVDPEGVDG